MIQLDNPSGCLSLRIRRRKPASPLRRLMRAIAAGLPAYIEHLERLSAS